MESIKRIAIIGNAGSGKSTLSKQLLQFFKLPIYHLDQYFWRPNWTHPDINEYKIIHDNLCDKDEWIIDGMNLRLLGYRAERADMIIFLDIPRYICYYQILKRMVRYYGKETPSSAKGCSEKFTFRTFGFLKWVWNFKKRYPGKINEILNSYSKSKQIYILQSQKEVNWFLEKLRN